MSSEEPLQQTRTGELPRFSWKAFCCGEFTAFHAFLLILLAFATYGFQFLVPAYRADDIIQMQPASGDSMMFLILGRWGYYWIFQHILDTSSGGVAAGFAGILLQILAAFCVARVIGLRSGGAVFFFCALSTITVLFAYLFSFDSTRLAYPIGNLLAALGLYLCSRKHPVLGVLCFALCPGFYQASIQVAIAGAVGASLKNTLDGKRGFDVGSLVRYALLILVGLILYIVGTKVAYSLLDIHLARSDMELAALFSVENLDRFRRLFFSWSIPFLSGFRVEYFSNWIVVPSGIVVAVFLYFVCLKTFSQRLFCRGGYSLGLFLVLLVSPFLLSLAAPLQELFPPRTLFTFGMVYGILVALPLDDLFRRWGAAVSRTTDRVWQRISTVGVGIASFLLFGHMLLANEYALDDHLASQSDLMAVNRIISRIEMMGPSEGIDFTRPVPIYVYARSPWQKAGPRGDIKSARHPLHSRSWIFSFVDNRFQPVFGWNHREEEAVLKPLAEQRPVWPDPDSVFVHEGSVVVVF
ncbi:MAG: glucosyltransferase domain-containing protein [Puniceicoccales bacterium]